MLKRIVASALAAGLALPAPAVQAATRAGAPRPTRAVRSFTPALTPPGASPLALPLPDIPAPGGLLGAPAPETLPAAAGRTIPAALAEAAAPALRTISRQESSPSQLRRAGQNLAFDAAARNLPTDEIPAVQGTWTAPASRLSRPQAGASRRAAPAAAFLGAAAIPAAAWPQLLLPLAAATFLSALLAYDVWTGARFSRAFYWRLRRKPGPELVRRDLEQLFKVREAEKPEVLAFLKAWGSDGAAARKASLEQAQGDPALGPTKLLAAYLGEGDAARRLEVQGALAALRGGFDPIDRHVWLLAGRGESVPWLNHPVARERLAELAAALGMPALRPARPRHFRRMVWARAASSAVLAAAVLLTSHAGMRAFEARAQRENAARKVLENYWGEDAVIFTDVYKDPRVREAVDVLRRWSKDSGELKGLPRALMILRTSADPKADNVLMAVFRRAGVPGGLVLSAQSEKTLLTTLLERDNPLVWEQLRSFMEANARNPAATRKLMIMIAAAAEADTDKSFLTLFFFLKSPDRQVVRLAADKIAAYLHRPGKDFLALLGAAAQAHAEEPGVQLHCARFLLAELGAPAGRKLHFLKASSLIANVLERLEARDASREEDEPPYAHLIIALFQEALDGAPDSDPLRALAQLLTHHLAYDLISGGLEMDPRLVKSSEDLGLAVIDVPVSYYINPRLEQLRWMPIRIKHPVKGEAHALVRTMLTQSQLKGLHAAILQALEDGAKTSEQEEFLEEASFRAEALAALAEKAGLPQGGAPEDNAAEEINLHLRFGLGPFGRVFVERLREEGLAPNLGGPAADLDPRYMLRRSYSVTDIEKMRLILAEALRTGKLAADPATVFPIEGGVKTYFAQSLAVFEDVREKFFPGQAGTAGIMPLQRELRREQLNAMRLAWSSIDPAVREAAEKQVFEAWEKAWSKDLFVLQLQDIQHDLRTADPFQGWMVRFIGLLWLEGSAHDFDLSRELFAGAFASVRNGSRTDAWASVTPTLEEAERRAMALPQPMRELLVRMIDDEAGTVVRDALTAYPSLNAPFLGRGVTRRLNPYSPSSGMDSTFPTLRVRRFYGLAHLRALREELASASGGEQSQDEAQRNARSALAVLPVLERFARAIGRAEGDTPASRAAEEVNDIFEAAYGYIPYNSGYRQELLNAGLAPGAKPELEERFLRREYDAAGLRSLREFHRRQLDGGQGWNDQGARIPMPVIQRSYLHMALEVIDQALETHYPREPVMVPETLGAAMAGLKDPTRRDAAKKDVAARLDALSDDKFIAELFGALARRRDDPELQGEIAKLFVGRLAGKTTVLASEKPQFRMFWKSLEETLAESGREREAWSVLIAAMDDPSPALKSFAVDLVNANAEELVRHSYSNDPFYFKNAGLVLPGGQYRKHFTRRHLRDLQLGILTRTGYGHMNSLIKARVERTIPHLRAVAAKAGVPDGTTPGENLADEVNIMLHALGQHYFPDTTYAGELQAAGLLPAGTKLPPKDIEEDLPRTYSQKDLEDLAKYHRKLIEEGLAPSRNGIREALGASAFESLAAVAGRLEEMAKNYDSFAKPDTSP